MQQAFDLLEGEHFGQTSAEPWSREKRRRVYGDLALSREEPAKAAGSRQVPRRRPGRETGFVERDEKARNDKAVEVLRIRNALVFCERRQAAEVGRVGGDRIGCERPLDAQMVEIGVDGMKEIHARTLSAPRRQ